MYAVKVQLADRPDSKDSETATSSSSYAQALRGPQQNGAELLEAVDVWTGNPRVEHLVGQVHLYRCEETGEPPSRLELPVSPSSCLHSAGHCKAGQLPEQPLRHLVPCCRSSEGPQYVCCPCRWI